MNQKEFIILLTDATAATVYQIEKILGDFQSHPGCTAEHSDISQITQRLLEDRKN